MRIERIARSSRFATSDSTERAPTFYGKTSRCLVCFSVFLRGRWRAHRNTHQIRGVLPLVYRVAISGQFLSVGSFHPLTSRNYTLIAKKVKRTATGPSDEVAEPPEEGISEISWRAIHALHPVSRADSAAMAPPSSRPSFTLIQPCFRWRLASVTLPRGAARQGGGYPAGRHPGRRGGRPA